MKLFLSLMILISPLFAKADLTCQGYNKIGQKIPVNATIYFKPQITRSPNPGPLIGPDAGRTVVTAAPNQKAEFESTYSFNNLQTRCVAGPTISTSGPELNINLWTWDACTHTPVDGFQGYKGTLKLNEPDGVQSIYLTCQEVTQPLTPGEGAFCGPFGVGQICNGECVTSRAQCIHHY